MATVIKPITVEVSKPNIFQAIAAKQNDSNSRFLNATFANEGEKINITPSAKVTINAVRSDGQSQSFFGTVNSDGTANLPIHSWILEHKGYVNCDISIIEADSKLTCTTFSLLVEEAANGSEDISGDAQFDVLTDLIQSVDGFEAEVEKLEKDLNSHVQTFNSFKTTTNNSLLGKVNSDNGRSVVFNPNQYDEEYEGGYSDEYRGENSDLCAGVYVRGVYEGYAYEDYEYPVKSDIVVANGKIRMKSENFYDEYNEEEGYYEDGWRTETDFEIDIHKKTVTGSETIKRQFREFLDVPNDVSSMLVQRENLDSTKFIDFIYDDGCDRFVPAISGEYRVTSIVTTGDGGHYLYFDKAYGSIGWYSELDKYDYPTRQKIVLYTLERVDGISPYDWSDGMIYEGIVWAVAVDADYSSQNPLVVGQTYFLEYELTYNEEYDDYEYFYSEVYQQNSLVLPAVTEADNGKILKVVNGKWTLANP